MKAPIFPNWLPIVLIPAIIIGILGLSCWMINRHRRRRRTLNAPQSTSEIAAPPRSEKSSMRTKLASPRPAHEKFSLSSSFAPSATCNQITNKSSSTSSSQFTDTDIACLDKLVRTASNRSLWKHGQPAGASSHKPRKVPSGQVQNEDL